MQIPLTSLSQSKPDERFRVLVLSETGGHHVQYSAAAKLLLDSLALKEHFTIDYIHDTKLIDRTFLGNYQLFIQLDYPPYAWGDKAVEAFIVYMNDKSHGWIGFHHATLLGTFDGYPMWEWFSSFMGGIQFKNYIATFADAQVNVEDTKHPVMRNVASTFTIEKEEWYTYDKSPRAKVHVIASVDEKTYRPESTVVMGDHPVVWTNESMPARNVYMFMGHGPWLFNNTAYRQIFANAINWASGYEKK
ncbi:MAG TPA: ThuA domain-containing protein [Chryseolinea sp.]|nr:ThuA domain-containing protein [Chryseolinea sp.]